MTGSSSASGRSRFQAGSEICLQCFDRHPFHDHSRGCNPVILVMLEFDVTRKTGCVSNRASLDSIIRIICIRRLVRSGIAMGCCRHIDEAVVLRIDQSKALFPTLLALLRCRWPRVYRVMLNQAVTALVIEILPFSVHFCIWQQLAYY